MHPNFPAPHPGGIIAEHLEHIDFSVAAASKALNVTRQTVHNLVKETNPTSLTAEMALRLEKAFGLPADLLLRVQKSHDLWRARQTLDLSIISRVSTV